MRSEASTGPELVFNPPEDPDMDRPVDLATELSSLSPRRGSFPWPDHEYVRGWGVFGLPFDTGHVLALRVFPENDFAPYRTVWHRTPDGAWSIFVDAPRLDIACPRYYAPACSATSFAHIEIEWSGPMSLRITMTSPKVDWTVDAIDTPLLRILNWISLRLPLWTWKPDWLVHARELMAKSLLGMGAIRMRGVMPSGHVGTLMPQRIYFIESSTAVLDGVNLGHPTHLDNPPVIGGVTLPCRGVLAVGQAAWKRLDPEEYQRTRAETGRADGARNSTA
jgi:hypothetical protein